MLAEMKIFYIDKAVITWPPPSPLQQSADSSVGGSGVRWCGGSVVLLSAHMPHQIPSGALRQPYDLRRQLKESQFTTPFAAGSSIRGINPLTCLVLTCHSAGVWVKLPVCLRR